MSWFRLRVWGIVTWVTLSLFVPVWADDDTVVFAVVSDVPKDRSRVSAKALLDAKPDPSVAEIKRALRHNLCRCTGYVKIIESVQAASGE